jgi:hypothetical protein
MDNSFHEQESRTQQDPQSFLVSLPILGNLIQMAGGKSYPVDGRRARGGRHLFILIVWEANEYQSNAFSPAYTKH